MQRRKVGVTGRTVGAIGLGCMGMSWAYAEATRDDTESTQVLRDAVGAGVDFIDTADVYGDGHNETLVGAALAQHRGEIFLATKGGLVVDDRLALRMHGDGSPKHMRAAIEASLRRLKVDTVDLYYLHRVDPAVPLADTWGEMATFVAEGKVRYLGLSEVSVSQADAAAAIHPVTAIQSEMSLWTRDALGGGAVGGSGSPASAVGGSGSPASASGDVVGWCVANGAAFVPFAPLGRGFLTGSITAETTFEEGDLRRNNPRFTEQARQRNAALLDAIGAIAARHDATAAQIAIAWTLAQGEHVIAIPGTRSRRHLLDNVGAADITLSPEDVAQLNELPAPQEARY